VSDAVILYAEDDENDVFLVTRAFRKAGLAAPQVVPNGRAAVDYLRNATAPDAAGRPARPVAVLLDLNMPFLSGLEVLSWIRSQPEYVSLPVAMFTSSNQLKDVSAAFARGATAYVIKPSGAEKLVELAKALREACTAEPFDLARFQCLPGSQRAPEGLAATSEG
jgi:CheY-like chemotaxis protein